MGAYSSAIAGLSSSGGPLLFLLESLDRQALGSFSFSTRTLACLIGGARFRGQPLTTQGKLRAIAASPFVSKTASICQKVRS
jgi:hypothetical protein